MFPLCLLTEQTGAHAWSGCGHLTPAPWTGLEGSRVLEWFLWLAKALFLLSKLYQLSPELGVSCPREAPELRAPTGWSPGSLIPLLSDCVWGGGRIGGIIALFLTSGSGLIPCILHSWEKWMWVRWEARPAENPKMKAALLPPGHHTALPSSMCFHLHSAQPFSKPYP